MADQIIEINRAPVLTLWGAIVAERCGHDWNTALTLGKGLAGLTAQSKGKHIGIFAEPIPDKGGAPSKKADLGENIWIKVCGRAIPARYTPEGIRAVVKDVPADPGSVEKYLSKAFGELLPAVKEAMGELAGSYPPQEIDAVGFGLYEKFRPSVDPGVQGWGQKGKLDIGKIRKMAAMSQ